jgi:hypothetical protein
MQYRIAYVQHTTRLLNVSHAPTESVHWMHHSVVAAAAAANPVNSPRLGLQMVAACVVGALQADRHDRKQHQQHNQEQAASTVTDVNGR